MVAEMTRSEMSPDLRERRNRSVFLWFGVLLCTASGAFFGAAIGMPNGLGLAGVFIGTVSGLVLGVGGARASARG